MSVSETAHRPAGRGRAVKLWIALIAVIALGIALAWAGAKPLRGETTASGLRIRTVKAGEGAYVQPVDGVLIEYEGRLPNGTVFDSSEGRGPTPMIAGQVIPGFAEALTKMQKGGRYRIHIPAKLAYGSTPPPGSPIPPNADLDFDVSVVQVVPNAALMTQSGPGGAGASPPEAHPEAQGQPQPQPKR
jgi:FKBP-type peptidyl-prolyl cis-trans isomerase FkpA